MRNLRVTEEQWETLQAAIDAALSKAWSHEMYYGAARNNQFAEDLSALAKALDQQVSV